MGRKKYGDYMVEKFPISDLDGQDMEEMVNKKSLTGIKTVKDFIRLAIKKLISEVKTRECQQVADPCGQSGLLCSEQSPCARKDASPRGLEALR